MLPHSKLLRQTINFFAHLFLMEIMLLANRGFTLESKVYHNDVRSMLNFIM